MTVGVALVLFCSVLLGVGIHHLIATGTCSSTGYSRYNGPVPICPAGTGAWFLFVAGGIIGGVAGSILAGTPNLVFGTVFTAIGLGAFTLNFDSHAAPFAKTFGRLFGGGFLAFGVIAAGVLLGGAVRGAGGARRRRTPAPADPSASTPSWSATSAAPMGASNADVASAFGAGLQEHDAVMGAYVTGQGTSAGASSTASSAAMGSPAARSSGVLDQISRLADLHTSGALSDAEFESEKAKLLRRM